jgi:hypothetical protein
VSTEGEVAGITGATHLQDLNERHAVIAGIQTAEEATARIVATFADRPDLVLIYQGVAKGLSQRDIARELETRGLPGASQPTLGRNIEKLERLWFLRKPKKGPHVVRLAWDEEFNLKRELGRILRKHKVAGL